jgi:uncharacterized protein (TIGR03086 family)
MSSLQTQQMDAPTPTEGALSKMVTMPVVGELPGGTLLVLAICDVFVHGWDLAKAIGVSTDLDPELAGSVLAAMRSVITEQMRGPGGNALFGAEVAIPPDASSMDRLVGFLGRRS